MSAVSTLRRLNDRERYWGLTFPQWGAAGVAGALLYGAVKISPLSTKPTITIVALIGALAGTVLMGVSGQALSPLRQLRAITCYRFAPKRWQLADAPDKTGLVLASAPLLDPHFDVPDQVDGPLLLNEWEQLDTAAEVSE